MSEMATAATTSNKERLRFLMPALLSSLITLLALSPIGYLLYRKLPPPVVTVDLQALLAEGQSRILENNLGGAEKRMITVAQKLSEAVDVIGKECRCIIVNKAALLGGATMDYTDQVRSRMKP